MTPITTHSFLDEEVTVILTREELYRIREWNKHEMGRAQQGMDAINSKPAKRSMRHSMSFTNAFATAFMALNRMKMSLWLNTTRN